MPETPAPGRAPRLSRLVRSHGLPGAGPQVCGFTRPFTAGRFGCSVRRVSTVKDGPGHRRKLGATGKAYLPTTHQPEDGGRRDTG